MSLQSYIQGLSALQLLLMCSDSSGSTIADSSGNSRDGTLSGGSTLAVDGPSDGSVAIRLSGGRIVGSGLPANTTSSSVSVGGWIKFADTTNAYVFGKGTPDAGPGYDFDRIFGQIRVHDSVVVATAPTDGEWHLLIINQTPSGASLSVDGGAFGSVAASGACTDSSGTNYTLGDANRSSYPYAPVNADICAWFVRTAATSDGEAAGIYNATFPTELIAGTVSLTTPSARGPVISTTAATGGIAPRLYQFQRAPDVSGSPGSWADVGMQDTALTYTDTGLTPGATYHYRVIVTDSEFTTATSSPITVTTCTRKIVCVGNSNTLGSGASGATRTYPHVLGTILGTDFEIVNLGVGGQTLTQELALYDSAVHPLIDSALTANFVVVSEGTNEMGAAGNKTGEQCYATTLAYADKINADDAYGVFSTVPPATYDGVPTSFETRRLVYGGMIRVGVSGFGRAIVDIEADTRIGFPAASDNTTYYSTDKVHLNDTGLAILAEKVAAAVADAQWGLSPSLAASVPFLAGTAQAGSSSTITLGSTASAVDSYYNGQIVRLTGGAGSGQTRSIIAYNGATKVATVDVVWITAPNNTTAYALPGINPATTRIYEVVQRNYNITPGA